MEKGVGEGDNPDFGVKTYYQAMFCRKLHENERNWTKRGRRVPNGSLDPPMFQNLLLINKG